MLWIIILAIGSFIWALIDGEEIGFGLLGGLMGGFVGLILYGFFGAFIGMALPTVETKEEYQICALNDTTEVEGACYLFSGYIDEDLVIRYVINTDKGKHIEEIKGTENVYINEGDYTPTVKVYHKKLAHDWYYLFAYTIYSDEYVFYVPENTITNEYEIDLN